MKEKTNHKIFYPHILDLFWGLSVIDKIIPDVHHLWVGKDFFALFIKFFGSLGLKDPLFATIALALISGFEVINFVFYLLSFINFAKRKRSTYRKMVFSSNIIFHNFIWIILYWRPSIWRPIPTLRTWTVLAHFNCFMGFI